MMEYSNTMVCKKNYMILNGYKCFAQKKMLRNLVMVCSILLRYILYIYIYITLNQFCGSLCDY